MQSFSDFANTYTNGLTKEEIDKMYNQIMSFSPTSPLAEEESIVSKDEELTKPDSTGLDSSSDEVRNGT